VLVDASAAAAALNAAAASASATETETAPLTVTNATACGSKAPLAAINIEPSTELAAAALVKASGESVGTDTLAAINIKPPAEDGTLLMGNLPA
jgi:hypothetical protein